VLFESDELSICKFANNLRSIILFHGRSVKPYDHTTQSLFCRRI